MEFITKSTKILQVLLLYGLFLCFKTNLLFAQNYSDVWNKLSDVHFETIKKNGYEVDRPIFGIKAKNLEGQIIEVKGYMIPLSELNNQNYFVLSAYPYNLCYFCGNAGPETVMEVYTKNAIKYSSKPVVVKGRLVLNQTDFDALIYQLKEAEKIE